MQWGARWCCAVLWSKIWSLCPETNEKFSKDISSFEDLFDYSAELEINDIEESDEFYEIYTSVEAFHATLEKLEKKYGIPKESGLDWKAKELVELDLDDAKKLLVLIEKLEDIS